MPIIRCGSMRDVFSPAQDVMSIQDGINRMFAELWGDKEGETSVMRVMPPADIIEENDHFKVTLEMPGLKKEDIKVTLEDSTLTISGEKKKETETKEQTYHRVERSFGSFVRTFEMPSIVDAAKINAEFKDGILTVLLPKSEQAKPKEIQISVK
jgi:HSP20 family protein